MPARQRADVEKITISLTTPVSESGASGGTDFNLEQSAWRCTSAQVGKRSGARTSRLTWCRRLNRRPFACAEIIELACNVLKFTAEAASCAQRRSSGDASAAARQRDSGIGITCVKTLFESSPEA